MKRKLWTNKEVQLLKKLYPDNDTQEIAKKLNVTVDQVYNKVSKLGIKKSKEYHEKLMKIEAERLRKVGRKTRYSKGHKPANKGKKQKEYMRPEAIERTKKTRFKKGQTPLNHRPVGSERRDKDGYLLVKTKEPNVWELKHRIVWEDKHGEIPDSHAVVFKDGNIRNVTLDNLELISRQELMERNTIQRYPEELKKVLQLQGRVKNKIKEQINE